MIKKARYYKKTVDKMRGPSKNQDLKAAASKMEDIINLAVKNKAYSVLFSWRHVTSDPVIMNEVLDFMFENKIFSNWNDATLLDSLDDQVHVWWAEGGLSRRMFAYRYKSK